MTPDQAKAATAYLVAAFRPRDFGRTSEAIYVDGLLEFDYAAVTPILRAAVRDSWARMPSILEVRELLADRIPRPPAPALVERAHWTEEELAEARAAGRAVLREFLDRHPDLPARERPRRFEDLVTKTITVESEHVIEARRAAAREARRRCEMEVAATPPTEGDDR